MNAWSRAIGRREFLIRSGAVGVSSLAGSRAAKAFAASSASTELNVAAATTLVTTVATAAGLDVTAGDIDLAVARLQEWVGSADPALRDWVVNDIGDSAQTLGRSGPVGLREMVRSSDPAMRARGTVLVDLAGMALAGPDYHYPLAV